jgi:hypothetical protein
MNIVHVGARKNSAAYFYAIICQLETEKHKKTKKCWEDFLLDAKGQLLSSQKG